jgi:hypothetical protein
VAQLFQLHFLKMEKDKLYDPARNNERSPEPGFASVNTHTPEEEEQVQPLTPNQQPQRSEEEGSKKAAPDPR